jgi:hypothetical protein
LASAGRENNGENEERQNGSMPHGCTYLVIQGYLEGSPRGGAQGKLDRTVSRRNPRRLDGFGNDPFAILPGHVR